MGVYLRIIKTKYVMETNDKPSCTNWQKWDWGKDGNPDDPDNPKAPIPEDPNQLCLPFIFDEIGVKPPARLELVV